MPCCLAACTEREAKALLRELRDGEVSVNPFRQPWCDAASTASALDLPCYANAFIVRAHWAEGVESSHHPTLSAPAPEPPAR